MVPLSGVRRVRAPFCSVVRGSPSAVEHPLFHQVTVKSIKRLLAGCRQIETIRQREALAGVQVLMGRMRAQMPSILKRMQCYELLHAPSFNIFRAIRIERKEAVLHTPFLAFLLNPQAAHGQGCIFLKAFFAALGDLEDFKQPGFRDDPAAWSIDSEVYTGKWGIIDILIECPSEGYVLVIENKIDAEEGENQLGGYADWMEHKHSQYRRRQMIFLTPDGREPTSDQKRHWLPVSYSVHIQRFLDNAIAKVKPEDVKTCLRQYQKTVQQITNIRPEYANT